MEEKECETFSEHYKPLLVEEISLVEHPAQVHCGKCSVIGTLGCNDNRLESLSIPDLPADMQLPDGACSVELSFSNYCGIIPRGRHVEVTGILKLHNTATYRPYIEVDHIRIIKHARELISCNLKIRKLHMLTALDY